MSSMKKDTNINKSINMFKNKIKTMNEKQLNEISSLILKRQEYLKSEEEINSVIYSYKEIISENNYTNIDQLTKAIENINIYDIKENKSGNNIYYETNLDLGEFEFKMICSGYKNDPVHNLLINSEKYQFNIELNPIENYDHKIKSDENFEKFASLMYNDLNNNISSLDNKKTFYKVLKSIIEDIFYKIVYGKVF